MKVLIVEDNRHKLRTITDLLKQKGVEYDVARCGGEGIELLEQNKYILIILGIFNNAKAGIQFLLQVDRYYGLSDKPYPDIVIYSEFVSLIQDEDVLERIFGKAENEEQFYEIMQTWLEKNLKNLKTKVFIVEDEKYKIETIKKVLNELNFSDYVIATCLEEVKDVLKRSYDFDIMILDMKFPVNNDSDEMYSGIELMRDMEKEYAIIGYPLPKAIVYSILLFEDACKGDIPKSYYGQTIGEFGLRELLQQLC